MKNGLTEIIILHDCNAPRPDFSKIVRASGMKFFESMKSARGEIRITYAVFGGGYKLLANDVPVGKVNLKVKDFEGNGTRDIFDSAGKTITEKGMAYSAKDSGEHPENVIFVLVAFGRDNASKTFAFNQVRDMAGHQSWVYKWKFFCASCDSVLAEQLDIPEENFVLIEDDIEESFPDALNKLSGRIKESIDNS